MAVFGGMTLTNKGLVLQGKAQAGAQLNYTRIAVGDGSLTGQSIPALNGLISQKKSLAITRLKTLPPNKVTVGTVLRNADVATGFYWREVGLFAQDPDAGEILYAYANAGVTADYIPPGGGSDIIEKQFDVVVVVGTAANISATIDQSLVFAKKSELDAVDAAKVDKVSGKGLSTNDFTTVEKNKLAGIATGAGGAGAGTDTVIGNRTIADTTAPTGDTGTITTLLGWLANMIKSITGKSSWRTAPATTLEAAAAHNNDNVRHITTEERTTWNGKLNSSSVGNASGSVPLNNGTLNTNLNADMVDGYHFNQGLQTTNAPTFTGITLGAGVVTFNQSTMYYNLPTSGSWARGFIYRDATGTTERGGIGLFGTDGVNGNIYLAHGSSPWSNGTGLYVNASGNVGIKKTTASSALDVNGVVKGDAFQAVSTTETNDNVTLGYLDTQARIRVGGVGVSSGNGFEIQAVSDKKLFRVADNGQVTNYAPAGTAPFVVSSSTVVTSLNSDRVDGYDATTTNTASAIVVRDSNGIIQASRGYFLAAQGTMPLQISSTTLVSNLNADLLDGLQGANYMQAGTVAADANLNNVTNAGVYRMQASGMSGLPGSGYYYGQTLVLHAPGTDTAAQLIFPYIKASGPMYRRGNPTEIGGTGTYSPWYKIWTEENMGADGGLDADKLDNYHADTANTASTVVVRDANRIINAFRLATRLGSTVGGQLHQAMYMNDTDSGLRWGTGMYGAEAAGNVGADWALWCYDNTGATLEKAFSITRSTRAATFAGSVTATGAALGTGGLTIVSGNVGLNLPTNSAGTFARGLLLRNEVGITTYGGIGMLGNTTSGTTTINKLYMAHGASPWDSTLGIYVLPTGDTGIKTATPSQALDVAGNARASQFISYVPQGTAPLTVTSTTEVTGLNSQLHGGKTLAEVVQGSLSYAVTTGTYAALAASINPAPAALTAGLRLTIKAHVASPGPATLNVNGLGAKSIKKSNGNNANLALGGVYTLVYDGSAFILQGEGGEYGSAGAAQVLSGYTVGQENGLVDGAMANNGSIIITPSLADQPIPGGYHTGAGKVAANPNEPGKILAGQTYAGLAGTATSDANATASDLRSGKSAYVNGVRVVGNFQPITNTVGLGLITPSTNVFNNISFTLQINATPGMTLGALTIYAPSSTADFVYSSLTSPKSIRLPVMASWTRGQGSISSIIGLSGDQALCSLQNVSYNASTGVISCTYRWITSGSGSLYLDGSGVSLAAQYLLY